MREEKPIASYDAIVILGRSIGKETRGVRRADGTFQQPCWRPSSYFGYMTDRPVPHSGIYDNNINPSAERVMVAGGNACALAASYLYREQLINGSVPKLIVFAAGRPGYLQSEPGNLSEGSVLNAKFSQKLASAHLGAPEVLILDQNKSTKDDIEGSIELLKERGLQRIAFLTVWVHTKRSKAFLDTNVTDDVKAGMTVNFLDAETILGRIDNRYMRAFKGARKTSASRRTSYYEGRGRRYLIAGRY